MTHDALDMEVHEETIEVFLEPDTGSSWKGALLSTVIGAGGGPPYRFVAAPRDGRDHAAKSTASSRRFPLQAFQDLDAEPDDEWAELARKRLDELDAELRREGWQPRDDRGNHWWSLRYTR